MFKKVFFLNKLALLQGTLSRIEYVWHYQGGVQVTELFRLFERE